MIDGEGYNFELTDDVRKAVSFQTPKRIIDMLQNPPENCNCSFDSKALSYDFMPTTEAQNKFGNDAKKMANIHQHLDNITNLLKNKQ